MVMVKVLQELKGRFPDLFGDLTYTNLKTLVFRGIISKREIEKQLLIWGWMRKNLKFKNTDIRVARMFWEENYLDDKVLLGLLITQGVEVKKSVRIKEKMARLGFSIWYWGLLKKALDNGLALQDLENYQWKRRLTINRKEDKLEVIPVIEIIPKKSEVEKIKGDEV